MIEMKESMRIVDHPILGADEPKKKVTIYYEGTPIEANEGEPIAVALANAGIRALYVSERLGTSHGLFCGQGRCGSCRTGIPHGGAAYRQMQRSL